MEKTNQEIRAEYYRLVTVLGRDKAKEEMIQKYGERVEKMIAAINESANRLAKTKAWPRR